MRKFISLGLACLIAFAPVAAAAQLMTLGAGPGGASVAGTFATWDTATAGTSPAPSFSGGNLVMTTPNASQTGARVTCGTTTAKIHMEFTVAFTGSTGGTWALGVGNTGSNYNTAGGGGDLTLLFAQPSNGRAVFNANSYGSPYAGVAGSNFSFPWATGNTVAMELDPVGKTWGMNLVVAGTPQGWVDFSYGTASPTITFAAPATPLYFAVVMFGQSNYNVTVNAGQSTFLVTPRSGYAAC